jgi:dTDP-4-dehydrorhamnose 3,5-epimerase-like enzyme
MSSSITFESLDVYDDERGWVSEIFSGRTEVTIRNIHIGTLKPGVVRGNHYHEHTREWIAFGDHPIEVRWGEPGDYRSEKLEEPTRVHLPPEVPHAFKNLAETTITFGAYTDTRYDSDDPDVKTVELF